MQRAPADLSPAQGRWVVVFIVALHLAAIWALLQMRAVRDAVTQVAPIFVDLIAPSAPTPVPVAAPVPAPVPVPKTLPAPSPSRAKPVRKQHVAKPPPAPILSTPAPAPAETAPVPAAPIPPPPPMAEVALPAAPPAPQPTAMAPPAPMRIPDAAVQYLEPPQPQYPALSLRKREAGTVIVRAFVGQAGGVPRSVDIERSSGRARLDQAALAAVRLARFKPYAVNGVPVEGWALIPIRFELEK